MKKFTPCIPFLLIVLLLSSCYSGKKAQLNTVLTEVSTIKDADTKLIEATKAKVEDRLKAEVIDANIADSIRVKVARYSNDLDSFKNAIAFIDEKVNTGRRTYKRNEDAIDSSFALIDRYKSKLNYRVRRLTMINEAMDVIVNQQHMFDLAAFFGPGKYEIPADKQDVAQQAFSPLIDSLVTFYNKYADVEKRATLVILGYADGSGFNAESEIYTELVRLLNDSTASKEKMNQKLSELRAVNIGDLMEISIEKKIPNYKDIKAIDFVFIEKGKGEEYPSKLVTDYKVEDERRRVVLLFWNILPK